MQMKRRNFIRNSVMGGVALSLAPASAFSKYNFKPVAGRRIGMIGLDTSHSVAFARSLNNSKNDAFKGFKLTCAYPYGSRTIKTSYERIPTYIKEVEGLGVQIKGSLKEVIDNSDCILLETNDGNLHLQQAIEVMKAGKPLFIDKPLAGNISDVKALYQASQKYKMPFFTSSSLRYIKGLEDIRNGTTAGKVLGADAFAPCKEEPSHTNFYWYGIHGVEILFTALGPGCQRVQTIHTPDTDIVTGVWNDGQIGIFRGIRKGATDYGGTVFCEKKVVKLPSYSGYDSLLEKVVDFFDSGILPVPEQETKEIYAFMTAAALSIKKKGAWVALEKF